MKLRPLLFSALTALSTLSCQTLHWHRSELKDTHRTSIIFLVDGLSTKVLRNARESGRVPDIEDYFGLKHGAEFRLGRASFPSLTYPNLTSILTGKSVAQQPVIGNHIWFSDEVADFEDVIDWRKLDAIIREQTIFYQLSQQDETSASFSYQFPDDATVHLVQNLSAGVDYYEEDYASIDQKTLASLNDLLRQTSASLWPRFIFVHLIGVDATEHKYGPEDPRVQDYLQDLDGGLEDVFEALDIGSRAGHQVQAVLTADHGFTSTTTFSPAESYVRGMKWPDHFLVDNRIASYRLPENLGLSDRFAIAQQMLGIPHIEWSIVRSPSEIDVLNNHGQRGRIELAVKACAHGSIAARFTWIDQPNARKAKYQCPEDFDAGADLENNNYLVPALIDYFTGPDAPDGVIVADDSSDFTGKYRGNHGGLMRDEMIVPLLTRNVKLPEGAWPTYRLLDLFHLPEPSHPKSN